MSDKRHALGGAPYGTQTLHSRCHRLGSSHLVTKTALGEAGSVPVLDGTVRQRLCPE